MLTHALAALTSVICCLSVVICSAAVNTRVGTFSPPLGGGQGYEHTAAAAEAIFNIGALSARRSSPRW